MKIRSWYIAVIGVAIQFIASLILLIFSKEAGAWLGLIVGLIAVYMLGFSIISLIPLLFLVFRRTLKLGGVIAILFGVIGIITQVGFIAGAALIISGLLALLKNM